MSPVADGRDRGLEGAPRERQRFDGILAPRAALRVMCLTVVGLVTVSVLGQLAVHLLPDFPLKGGLAFALYVDREQSLPTVVTCLGLLTAAGLLATIAGIRRRAGRAYVRHWLGLSIVFVAVAADDYLALHEQAIEPMREILGVTGGGLYYAWVVPGALFVLVLSLVYLRFLLALPRPTARLFLAAACLFVGGALGMELVGGSYAGVHGQNNLPYTFIVTVEETLEMAGVVVFLYALLRYLDDHLGGMSWRLRTEASASAGQTSSE